MMPLSITLGDEHARSRLVLHVEGYEHPERAEPADLDLLRCRITAHAGGLEAAFVMSLGLWELLEVADYLGEIVSGNGPSRHFNLAGGLLSLAFAPTRRGPVLCAVMLKTIDASHVRLEFLVTLEPQDIGRARMQLAQLRAAAQKTS